MSNRKPKIYTAKNDVVAMQIDYINLTYTCSGMDVYEMREFLDDNNGANIKIIAKVQALMLQDA